jgi:trigger factor
LLVRVEELEAWKRKLTIGLSEADVKAKADELLDEVAKDAVAPGFRKGKVPRAMVERNHGQETLAKALRTLAGGAYADAVREAELHPISDPVVELDEEIKDGQYTLTATFEVKPEVELKDYEGLEFTERVPVVTNEDVEKYIEGLREQHADLNVAARPSASGDIVVLDYEAMGEDGKPLPDSKSEDYICELGKGQVPPEIEEALVGVSVGDEKTVKVKYPDDFRVEAMAGKEMSFAVKVKDVRVKLLPPVDEAFAKKLGLETLLDLRVKVRDGLESRAKAWARQRLEEEIVKEVVERNPFELPEGLVQHRLERTFVRMQQGQGTAEGEEDERATVEVPEDFAKVYRPMVEQQLKAGILLGKIAETNGTEVTEEDIKNRVTSIAEAQGQNADELMENLAGSDALSQMEDDIWLEKVHDFLVSVSRVSTEPLDLSKEAAEAGGGTAGEAGTGPTAEGASG